MLFSLGARSLVEVPLKAIRHGGPAFIMAYIFLWVLVVLPLSELHTALGRTHARGLLGVLPRTPLARGIGWSFMVYVGVSVAINGVPAGYSLYYLSLLESAVRKKQLMP